MDGVIPPNDGYGYADLYRRDFVAWTRAQVELLRKGEAARLDWQHIADALDLMAGDMATMSVSGVRIAIEHLLKLEYSPAHEPRRVWRSSVRHARRLAETAFERSPVLRADLDLDRVYRKACKDAADGLRDFGELDAAAALPDRCPYTLDQILDPDFFPANRHGHA